jgi:hypothetical protein
MSREPATADALKFHFEGGAAPPGWVLRSALMALIAHARAETGRDSETGQVIDESRTGSWLGATAYLILLDQIGKCLKPASAPNPAGPSSVERALQVWSDRSHGEQCALCALRNALAHDFCLFNFNKNNPDCQHRFTLDRHPTRLIALPADRWSGDYLSTKQDTTIVSLRALGDLVEAVVAAVKRETAAGNVAITLTGGSTELIRRYGIVHAA